MPRILSELCCASSAVRSMKSTAEPPVIGIPAGNDADAAAGIVVRRHARPPSWPFPVVQFFVSRLGHVGLAGPCSAMKR
jgi:hypothetical protein